VLEPPFWPIALIIAIALRATFNHQQLDTLFPTVNKERAISMIFMLIPLFPMPLFLLSLIPILTLLPILPLPPMSDHDTKSRRPLGTTIFLQQTFPYIDDLVGVHSDVHCRDDVPKVGHGRGPKQTLRTLEVEMVGMEGSEDEADVLQVLHS